MRNFTIEFFRDLVGAFEEAVARAHGGDGTYGGAETPLSVRATKGQLLLYVEKCLTAEAGP